MLSARTTVVAVLAATEEEAERAAQTLTAARNVRRLDAPDEADEPDGDRLGHRPANPAPADPGTRATAVLAEAARTRAPYAVQRVDPLERVAAAWRRFFAGTGGHGELEIAVADALRRWRAGGLELPDYYLAVEPESWPPTLRHWALGILHHSAPHRVVPVAAPPPPGVLSELNAGRWWPPLDRLLDGLRDRVPETVPRSGRRGASLLDPAGRAHPPASELAGADGAETRLWAPSNPDEPDGPEGPEGFPTLEDLQWLDDLGTPEDGPGSDERTDEPPPHDRSPDDPPSDSGRPDDGPGPGGSDPSQR